MINVCINCGEYRADKSIDVERQVAICPLCSHVHPFRFLPLFFVCGASGTGKSTLTNHLLHQFDEVVLLDADILWRPEFNTPEDSYRDFFETLLRLAKNIGQSGKPVVILGAGCTPPNVEPCVERRYFANVHYLALVCDDDVVRERLRKRPSWRNTQDDTFIHGQIEFNQWLKAEPAITCLDTGKHSIEASAQMVKEWIRPYLPQQTKP